MRVIEHHWRCYKRYQVLSTTNDPTYHRELNDVYFIVFSNSPPAIEFLRAYVAQTYCSCFFTVRGRGERGAGSSTIFEYVHGINLGGGRGGGCNLRDARGRWDTVKCHGVP